MNRTVLRVTCALVVNEGKVLAARRGPGMDHAGKWEFPGGKVKEGETPGACVVRELREELGIVIEVLRALPPLRHDYPHRSIELLPFVCALAGGTLSVTEHREARWCGWEELDGLDWAEADARIVRRDVNPASSEKLFFSMKPG